MTDKTPFVLEDFYKFKFLMNMSVSKDGSKIAYVLASYHDKEKKDEKTEEFPKEEKSNIWILDVKTNFSKQYTFGTINANPSFSPDGKILAFTSKRTDESQIYLLPVDGGEAEQLTNNKVGVSSKPIWSPDGKKIVFTASSLDKKPDLKKPYRFKRDFYRFDGAGNIDNFKQDIFILDIATKEIQKVTSDDKHHFNPSWSPDGSKLLWLTSFSSAGVDAFRPTISILQDGKITQFLKEWGYAGLAEWYTDKQIVYLGEPKGLIHGSKNDIFTLSIESGTINCRSEGCQLGIGGGLESFVPGYEGRMYKLIVKQDKVFTTIQNRGVLSIYSFNLTGDESFSEIVGGDRSCFIHTISNNLLFFICSEFDNPSDIFCFDLSNSVEQQLTHLNKEFLDTKQLATVKKFEVPCVDNAKTDGWLLMPDTKAPYPTLLKIHGGPHAGYGHIFYWDAQLLCGAGYAILMINHRGSTGYGNAFATAINGDWGNLDFKDLMAGVDTGISLGLINGDRLGCFGISGGGNLSSWIVGNTDRFKAAVPENPLTNWLSFYGVSDIGRWFAVEELGGLPYEVPEKYVKCSPITYAHNCKTPTLMIQHDNDLRCPVEQTEQFYAVLRDAGCIVEMLRMPGTPHSGSIIGPLEIRQARSEALLDWFKKYV